MPPTNRRGSYWGRLARASRSPSSGSSTTAVAAEGPDHLPGRVDLQVLDAVAAPQPLVVGELDPGLADEVAGLVAPEALLLELVGRDLAHVAEHVGGGRPGRVLAQGQHLGGDPGEPVGVLGQVEELAGGGVLGGPDAAP